MYPTAAVAYNQQVFKAISRILKKKIFLKTFWIILIRFDNIVNDEAVEFSIRALTSVSIILSFFSKF